MSCRRRCSKDASGIAASLAISVSSEDTEHGGNCGEPSGGLLFSGFTKGPPYDVLISITWDAGSLSVAVAAKWTSMRAETGVVRAGGGEVRAGGEGEWAGGVGGVRR